jgi:hypothetical protein
MGARVKSRPKIVDWSGGFYLDRGRIESFKGYAFDYQGQGVQRITNQRITWSSTTGGDSDGVLLKIEAPEDATATFYSKQVSFNFKPHEIKHEPTIIDVGPVNRKVKIQKIMDGKLPRNIKFTFNDKEIKKGINQYWVKVTQSDGSMAWTSPVYANY